MPVFTINEVENHRQKSGKLPGFAIIKTLDRGRRFKEERYISSDSVYTASQNNMFYVKAVCKASMKKEFRDIEIVINKLSSNVISAKCTCPAGKSSYCNHIMALLLELADYSLNQYIEVPSETSCTSKSRQWGIPSKNKVFKDPISFTVIIITER